MPSRLRWHFSTGNVSYFLEGMIKWEQMVLLENLEHGCELQPIDFAGFARVCGGTGFTIENLAEYCGILNQGLATPGPVTIEAVVDPFEPRCLPR